MVNRAHACDCPDYSLLRWLENGGVVLGKKNTVFTFLGNMSLGDE
jgi:hypothetical protein